VGKWIGDDLSHPAVGEPITAAVSRIGGLRVRPGRPISAMLLPRP